MKLKKDNLHSVAAGIVLILTAACSESVPENTSVVVKAEPSKAAAVSAEDAEMARGKLVFASCALCHSTGVGGPSTIGPNLAGVLGSEAGASDDFTYSEPLLASGIVWTEDVLDKYIESPATFLPGGTMGFVGIADAKDRQSLITYLIAKTGGADGSDPALLSDQGDDVAAWE
jgi:cytochrome c2